MPTNKFLTLLSNRNYRFLIFSNSLWWQTLFMEMIVIGWLVLDLTNSPWQVALVGFFRTAPFLVSGFIGGPLTDRLGRRQIIQLTQTASLLVYGTIALLIYSDVIELWHLALLSFIIGSGWSLEFPARRSLIPDLLGKEKTVDGLLLESFVQGISRIIGPFLAGTLIEQYGAIGCFICMTLLSLVALASVLRLSNVQIVRLSDGQGESTESPLALIGQGFRYVRHNEAIFAVVLVTMIMNFLIFPYTTLLPVFARDILGRGPAGLGILGTATGIGAFIGLYLINRLRSPGHRGRQAIPDGRIFLIGSMVQCLGLLLFSLSASFMLSWILLFFAGVGQACFAILQSSIVLMASRDDMRSRAMATIVLAIGADPIGKIQTGLMAEKFGAPFTLGIHAGLALLLVGLVLLWLPNAHRQQVATYTILSSD